MSKPHSNNIDFLEQVTAVIAENLSDEKFGVSELAAEMNMSRSNLLRRVKQSTKSSVSQLIREVRLKHGMELLRNTSLSVSEVSHQVGFSGTSYFIKCFREYYGYPPGEAGKRKAEEVLPTVMEQPRRRGRFLLLGAIAVVLILAAGVLTFRALRTTSLPPEKSIAVLPFKNDSGDSSNIYLINGLMEATLNNLQKIKDLRVISRTSSEKYRYTFKSVPEMARELNVNYFVAGSGQKIGNRILLNIRLIDAGSDRQLWARQYERELTDIFQLQQEIANDIAKEAQAFMTWEEEKRIEKVPTSNLIAYDLVLKASELMRQGGTDNLESAISLLKQAIELDREFALAHALVAISYYYLDAFQMQPQYEKMIGAFADKAMLHDPTLVESLFAKSLHYARQKAYESAVPYLEKALEYNPNSVRVIRFLSDLYNWHIPNAAKYLEYALQGIRLDATAYDSTTVGLNYFHVSNALIQTGFVDESLEFIEKSLVYYPENPYAGWVKAGVLFAKDRDPDKLESRYLAELAKDSTKIYILQELGKLYYHEGNDREAYRYYQRFVQIRESHQLDVFQDADLIIGALWTKMGLEEEGERFVKQYKEFAKRDESIYKHLHLAMYFAYRSDPQKTIRHLQLFSREENYQYWVLLLDDGPMSDPKVGPIRDLPEFKEAMRTIETKFWDKHGEIRKKLEEKGLL